ncbi:MAG TPA: FTR1 family protein [Coriobacteriia bacterium]|jgi:FTR1 family protein
MDALVITLREGIEAALVIGIILAFVRKTGREGLVRWVLAGIGAGVGFSLLTAFVLGRLGIGADNPAVEAVLYLVAAAAVVSMVVWMWRSSRNVRGQVESRLSSIVSDGKSARRIGLGLLLLSFFMIAREGVESVIFIAASALGRSGGVPLVVGGLAGVGLAVAYGVLFARGSVRVDLRLFFTLTSIVLILLAVKLVGGSIHEFEEAGILPMSETMAHFFDAFAASPLTDWLFLVALAVPLAAPLLSRNARGQGRPATGN